MPQSVDKLKHIALFEEFCILKRNVSKCGTLHILTVSFNLNKLKNLLPILILAISQLSSYNSFGQDQSDSNANNGSTLFIEVLFLLNLEEMHH